MVEHHSSRGEELWIIMVEMLTGSFADFLEEAEVRPVPVKRVEPVDLCTNNVAEPCGWSIAFKSLQNISLVFRAPFLFGLM